MDNPKERRSPWPVDTNVGSRSDGKPLYDLREAKDYRRAIVDFLSLLTDRGIIEYYTELTTF